MKKTFKYRLLANKQTFAEADRWLGLCRNLYNAGLEQRIAIYHQDRGRISCYDQLNQLPALKVAMPEYGDVGSQVLQDVLERLDRAYAGFFRRVKKGEKAGFPRFKGRGWYNSFTLKQAGWKLEGKYLTIRNVGRFKIRLSRSIEGEIKTVTLRRDAVGHWYVCFSCAHVLKKSLPLNDKVIGLDVGIASFLTDSEGRKVENPKCLRQAQAILRRKQRTLARRKKGSNRRAKARVQVAMCHEKIRRQRLDFLHKTANHYIANYGTIVVEDLNIAGMVRNHSLAKSISDAGWGIFFGILDYKAEEAGRNVCQSPRFKPTSKECSVCGEVNHNLKLSDREWTCESCGAHHDRDENAAKNISRVGQPRQELTYVDAQSVS